MLNQSDNTKHFEPVTAHFTTEGDAEGMPAWSEIAEGRFMPRRVRGSCQGRALG